MRTLKTFKALLLLLVVMGATNLYSQEQNKEENKNFISIKKGVVNTLLLEDSDSPIFDQSKPTSHLFNETYSDYNISYQRKVSTNFLLGLDFYGFNAYNRIDPVSLHIPALNAREITAYTDIKIFRASIFYSIFNREHFKIRGGVYIPFWKMENSTLTGAYEDKADKDKLVAYVSTDVNDNNFFFGIVEPEVAVDFLYSFKNIETGVSTSWNSNISPNEPIIRLSAVLNVKF